MYEKGSWFVIATTKGDFPKEYRFAASMSLDDVKAEVQKALDGLWMKCARNVLFTRHEGYAEMMQGGRNDC